MSGAAPVAVEGLVKRYGETMAVDGLSFAISSGRITGFLGPNGAGKTTTLRAVLGLVHPTSGRALVHGRSFAELEDPARMVGAALEPNAFHPGRSGRAHLTALAAAARLPGSRVDEVLEIVELTPAGERRVGGYSLGLRQRLALAGALLGDPSVLVLDEPANGLDPQGMRWPKSPRRSMSWSSSGPASSWLRRRWPSSWRPAMAGCGSVRRGWASCGRCSRWLETSTAPPAAACARMTSRNQLEARAGVQARDAGDGLMIVGGVDPEDVGLVAAEHGVPLFELSREQATLEAAFLELTGEGGHVR